VKNEGRFSTAKNTSNYSEFNAVSEYVILFEKYFGQTNDLIDTCPFHIVCVFETRRVLEY
jgi:hypothetical protein